jgi:hypothetical protein
MPYREIIGVCSEIRTKHINTPCWQNTEFFNVRHDGTYSNHWALKGYGFHYTLDLLDTVPFFEIQFINTVLGAVSVLGFR